MSQLFNDFSFVYAWCCFMKAGYYCMWYCKYRHERIPNLS